MFSDELDMKTEERRDLMDVSYVLGSYNEGHDVTIYHNVKDHKKSRLDGRGNWRGMKMCTFDRPLHVVCYISAVYF